MWGAAGGEGPGKVGGARVWGPGLLSQTQASLCGLGSTESWEALACVCGRNKGDRSWAAAGGGGWKQRGRRVRQPVDLGGHPGQSL